MWSAFHSDQWEGTVPGTGRWEAAVTHRVSTIENSWTGVFETMSIWRKPHFGYIDFSIFEPSVFSSQTQSVSGSHLKLREARKSKWLAGSYQFLNQGLHPSPQQWKHEVLTTGWPGNSLSVLSTYFSLYSLVLTSQKLRVLMLRFLKGEANSSWLMWQIYLSSAIILQNNAIGYNSEHRP